MSIHLVGLNHRTATVDIREQMAFSPEGVSTALMLFRNRFPNAEAALISTCNRVEMIIASKSDTPNANDIISFFAEARDLPVNNFQNYLYRFSDEQAVRHLYRVASGLDSLVLGEYQIVNQIKTAYAQASEQGTTGRILNHLFHKALNISKSIRTETEITLGKTSVPSVAVNVAKSIFNDFEEKKILVVGAGEMARLVCQHLREAKAKHFVITSRTLNNARILAETCNGQAVPFQQLQDQLCDTDILITAVRCPKTVITESMVRQTLKSRNNRSLFIIDLAVPRNVEPAVDQLNQVYVYDIDRLGQIVENNQSLRHQQLKQCEMILDQAVEDFETWLTENQSRPIIAQIYEDAMYLKEMELTRFFNSCDGLNEQQKQAVTQLTERLTGKFIHPYAQTIRQNSYSKSTTMMAELLHNVVTKFRKK